MWQGPAPTIRSWQTGLLQLALVLELGTSELGNNGIHGLDVARWGLGVDALTVTSAGGKYVFDDDQEVPDTQVVTWEFPRPASSARNADVVKHGTEGSGFGIAFYGDKGTLVVSERAGDPSRPDGGPPSEAGRGKATGGVAAHVRTSSTASGREAPNAEIEVSHLNTRLCHLGNIAHRVGRKLTFDPAARRSRTPDADKLLSREYGNRFEMPSPSLSGFEPSVGLNEGGKFMAPPRAPTSSARR